MNKKIAAMLLLVVFISTLFGNGVGAEMSGAPAVGQSNSREIFFDERVFRGTSAKQDAFFEIGKGQTLLPGSSLDLYISHSETLLPDHSSLTILIDDVPLTSTALDESNQKETLWKIDLSSLNLAPGFHKITFWSHMKTSTLICEDTQNSSAWMIVHKKSSVQLQLGASYQQADLRWYPSPFVERGFTNPLQAVLAVPDNPTDDELRAAAQLSQFWARQMPTGKLNIPVYTESDLTDAILNGKSIVWLGQADRWKKHGKSVLEQLQARHPAVSAFGGYIAVDASRWNAQHTSLIVAGDGPRLINAARILSVEALYSQLQGTYTEVPEKLTDLQDDETPRTGERRIVTLEELGYDNLVTEYVLEGSSTIQYTIPDHWDLSEGATLHLVYKHSRSILYEKSVMTVKLNNVPVRSVKLVEATSDRGVVEIPLDPKIIGNNRTMSIEIGFQFANPGWNPDDPAASAFCTDTLLGDWAVVDKTTFLSFTPHERESFNLDALPFPFVSNHQWEPTTLIMKDRTSATLNTALTWLGMMGADLHRADIRLANAAEVNAESLQNRHIVYVGTADGLPDDLNGTAHAFVQFGKNNVISRSDHVELLPSLQHQSAVMQLVPSPFDDDHYMLHLVATNRDSLSALGEVLANPEKSASIVGRVIVIDSREEVFVFPGTIDARKTEQPTLAPEAVWKKPIPYAQYVFIGACAIILIGIATLISAIRKRRMQ